MSDAPVDRLKPTKATAILSEFTEPSHAHGEHAAEPSEPSQDDQPEIESEQGTSSADRFQEFREWCERRRTQWPDSKDDFLSDKECLLIIDIEDSYPSNPCKTKKDYSWVPNALWEIFNRSLSPEAKLNILEYFLSLLSVLIISDSMAGGPDARVYRELLLRTVAPSPSCLSQEPDYLGSLEPPKAPDHSPSGGSESEEISLVRDLRYLLHLHTRDPR